MAAIIGRKKIDAFQKKVSDKTSEHSFSWRINVLACFIFFISLTIFCKLYFLQIISHDSFKDLAENQHNIFKKLIPERGEIFLQDKDGLYPVAVNREAKMAYAVPKEIEDGNIEKIALAVSQIFSLDESEVRMKLEKRDDMYEVLKHRLSDDEINKINEANIAGIHLAAESYRYYPSADLAAQLIGFVGWSGDLFGGRYGIESFFDEELKGHEGNIFQSRDSGGRQITIGKKEIQGAQNGPNLILTIDHIVQYETEKILKGAMEKFRAENGSIIVMETKTGKILSMASYPTFDPNNYSAVEDIGAYRNLNVSNAYECGSVFKAITMAAGLDSDKVAPETTYVDNGVVKEAGYTIRNSDLKANGLQTMTEVLEKSLNTGVIFVEKNLGNKNFVEYVRRFGFGELTGVEVPGESAGNIKNLENLKSDIQFFTASFGQGITVTPIQLISAYNALANGGVLMKPQIIEKKIYSDGSEEKIIPQEIRRVISEKASLQISQMLRSVVINGHGKQAGVPGHAVAGKTGTAQVASSQKKGYEEGMNIGSFAGFAPLGDPRFTVLVRITNPKDVQWAESSAAPTFGELMKFLLEYYNIEPTEEYTQADLDRFNQTHNFGQIFLEKERERKAKEEEEKKNEENKNIN
jgi:cell division protein FtsI/penicillin-binding protein 2